MATLPYDARIIARVEAWRATGGRTALVTATDATLAEARRGASGTVRRGCKWQQRGTQPERPGESAVPDRAFRPARVRRTSATAWPILPFGMPPSTRSASGAPGAPCAAGSTRERDRAPRAICRRRARLAGALLRALRPQQWLKNLLVFVPMISDLTFDWAAVLFLHDGLRRAEFRGLGRVCP